MNFSRTWEQILIFRYTFHHTFSIEKLKNILFSLIKVSPSIFISFHFFKCEKNPKVNFDVSEYFVVKGFPCFNDFFFLFFLCNYDDRKQWISSDKSSKLLSTMKKHYDEFFMHLKMLIAKSFVSPLNFFF